MRYDRAVMALEDIAEKRACGWEGVSKYARHVLNLIRDKPSRKGQQGHLSIVEKPEN